MSVTLAEQGLGLAYAFEPAARERIRAGRLRVVLDAYAATIPGIFLCYASVAQRSEPLRLFVEAAKEFAVRG
jgi:DNA-binding transcriptional LysR family regulator